MQILLNNYDVHGGMAAAKTVPFGYFQKQGWYEISKMIKKEDYSIRV